jgi:hypothetical protein
LLRVSIVKRPLQPAGCLSCLCLCETEVFGNAQRQFNRRIATLFINERRQNAWPKLHRNRIQVVGRRQSPALIARIEIAMIAQMIICIRDQNGEDNPPPQFMQVFSGSRAVLLNRVGNFQVATSSSKADASVHHPRTAEPCPSKRASGEKGIFRYAPEPLLPRNTSLLRSHYWLPFPPPHWSPLTVLPHF